VSFFRRAAPGLLTQFISVDLPRATASTGCHGTGHQIQCARFRASVDRRRDQTSIGKANCSIFLYSAYSFHQSASQLASLRLAIASVKPQAQSESENESAMHIDAGPEPSDTAIVTALFGWSLAPPAPPLERNRTSSVSRMATMSRPASPSLSRSSSVSRTVQLGRADLPSPRPSSSLTSISQLGGTPLRTRMPRLSDLGKSTRDTSLLHCSLCQRRVGLWAFTLQSTPSPLDGSPLPHPSIKKRQFDVLNEHRSYCPFVAPSTVVPKLPMPSTSPLSASVAADSVIEGWRAVLTVVLRHGLSERQRNARLSLSGGDHDGIDDELEGVEAMVAGVKSKGVSLFAQLDSLDRRLIAHLVGTRTIEICERTVGLMRILYLCLLVLNFHRLLRARCTCISNILISPTEESYQFIRPSWYK